MKESEATGVEFLAARLNALAHPARLYILTNLARQGCCACCKDVVSQLDLAQSTVSQHLKILVEAGLVKLTRQGTRSLYEVDRPALEALSGSVTNLLAKCCDGPCTAD